MIVTAHQPAYLPWLGYFEKIMRSDIYIYMDTVQFERRGFSHRNKIKTSQGACWLTIPVFSKGHRESTIQTLEIDNEQNWQKKHWKSICNNYSHAPFYHEYIQKIKPFYEKKYELLTELCYEYLLFWMKTLGIKTKVIKLSDLNVQGKKSDLILNICRHLHADTYISGALGKDYLREDEFERNGINIVYQDYRPKEYPQLWGGFMPCLSVLDFVMNTKAYCLIKGKD